MARQSHTPVSISASQPTLQPAANALDIAWTAADVVNFEEFAMTGKEILLARNTGASAYTVTIDGVVLLGRSGSITAYSLGAGEQLAIWLPTNGWRQTDGTLHFQAENVAVEFAVLQVS